MSQKSESLTSGESSPRSIVFKQFICFVCRTTSDGVLTIKEQYLCYTCEEYFCGECYTNNHKVNYPQHKAVVELLGSGLQQHHHWCEQHSQVLKDYCNNCERAMCKLCLLLSHSQRGHSIVSAMDKEAIMTRRSKLQLLISLKRQEQSIEDTNTHLVDVRQKVREHYADRQRDLRLYVSELKRQLDKWADTMENERQRGLRAMEKLLEDMANDMASLKGDYNSTVSLVDHMNKKDLPLIVYSELQQKLNEAGNNRPVRRENVTVLKLRQTPLALDRLGEWDTSDVTVSSTPRQIIRAWPERVPENMTSGLQQRTFSNPDLTAQLPTARESSTGILRNTSSPDNFTLSNNLAGHGLIIKHAPSSSQDSTHSLPLVDTLALVDSKQYTTTDCSYHERLSIPNEMTMGGDQEHCLQVDTADGCRAPPNGNHLTLKSTQRAISVTDLSNPPTTQNKTRPLAVTDNRINDQSTGKKSGFFGFFRKTKHRGSKMQKAKSISDLRPVTQFETQTSYQEDI